MLKVENMVEFEWEIHNLVFYLHVNKMQYSIWNYSMFISQTYKYESLVK